MKRILLISIFVCALGLIISSCKTHEKCPAYGSVEVELTDQTPS